ncbi:MAG: hypothetical protein DRP42_06785 [Tenericutes bacterium]|nr:MAG: hypothetical protein DRP42_06785 [Mycoplasmatota bacterium]
MKMTQREALELAMDSLEQQKGRGKDKRLQASMVLFSMQERLRKQKEKRDNQANIRKHWCCSQCQSRSVQRNSETKMLENYCSHLKRVLAAAEMGTRCQGFKLDS